jgi:hypothetical protein
VCVKITLAVVPHVVLLFLWLIHTFCRMLFVALFVVVAFAQGPPSPPQVNLCNTSFPMTRDRATQLLGPGGVGPTFISASPQFLSYVSLCNSATGCTPWQPSSGSNPYLWAGSSQYYASCSYAPRPFLQVVNGQLAAGFANAQGAICSNPTYVSNYGYYTESVTPSTALPTSCSSCVGITVGQNATSSTRLIMNGVISNTCYQFLSPTFSFPLNDNSGRVAYVSVAAGGPIGSNNFDRIVPLKLKH